MTTSRPLRTTALAAPPSAALATVHYAPVVSTFGPLRDRTMPRLSGRAHADHVARTFDAGPEPRSTPFSPRLLDERGVRGVRATFFLLSSAAHRSAGTPHGDRGPRRRRHYPAARLGPHLGPRRLALDALPRILDTCTQRGQEVGPLRDHGQPVPDTSCGNPLRPHIVYNYVDDRLCRSRSFLGAHRRQGTTARRMHLALESHRDPEAVLARFIDRLPATDEELLRQPLGNLPEER
ncbi:hypothetical protein [Streptomyces mirabilis]|uniref:hypothetical protein n=1 Tax=Streptomyces mirabilis TaxID=68239 RepID=UPI00368F7F4B